MSKLIELSKHLLNKFSVKITKHVKFVRIYILYYKVLKTSYIDLVLNRIVIFFFLKCFYFESKLFFLLCLRHLQALFVDSMLSQRENK